jgi:lipopolysaccharide transport system permease protein
MPKIKSTLKKLNAHNYLLAQLVKRDVLFRYRGAMFGMVWVFITPIVMLSIFTFVFGHILQVKVQIKSGEIPYWATIYIGLIVFNIFSECISRAPSTVRGHPSFVKKIVFPLHILPIVPMGSALIHSLFNFIVLIIALILVAKFNSSILIFPFLLMPIILISLGVSWFFAAWGVFIKDMTQIIPIFVQILMFLSPIFYPASIIPENIRPFYNYNPIGIVIEACRTTANGQAIDWLPWITATVTGFILSILGYAFFQHSREEFADVL